MIGYWELQVGKYVRWIALIVGLLLLLPVIAVAAVYGISTMNMSKSYTIPAERLTLAVPTDAATIERGRHLVTAVGKCPDCHGERLQGTAMIDDPALGRLVAKNLTKGQGGIGATYTDADFVRALRHGVDPAGRPLLFMPAQEFMHFSDADLGAIIAYVKSVPPVDNVPPASSIGPLGRALYVAGQLELLPAELVDHNAPRPAAPAPGVTPEYGRYLALTGGCMGCHGPGLSGGPVPGTPPDFKPALNITSGGRLGQWSEADFISAMRTGVTKDGYKLDEFMPWKAVGQLTDDELKALFAYLKSVPAKEYGNR